MCWISDAVVHQGVSHCCYSIVTGVLQLTAAHQLQHDKQLGFFFFPATDLCSKPLTTSSPSSTTLQVDSRYSHSNLNWMIWVFVAHLSCFCRFLQDRSLTASTNSATQLSHVKHQINVCSWFPRPSLTQEGSISFHVTRWTTWSSGWLNKPEMTDLD